MLNFTEHLRMNEIYHLLLYTRTISIVIRRGRGVVGWITFICNGNRVYQLQNNFYNSCCFRIDGHCMHLLLYDIIDYLFGGGSLYSIFVPPPPSPHVVIYVIWLSMTSWWNEKIWYWFLPEVLYYSDIQDFWWRFLLMAVFRPFRWTSMIVVSSKD